MHLLTRLMYMSDALLASHSCTTVMLLGSLKQELLFGLAYNF